MSRKHPDHNLALRLQKLLNEVQLAAINVPHEVEDP